ncbi:MAG: type 1 glutamine amidotransferase [Actinomycetota bacterium]|nr:type 1 glutamine amidotransferase [Actinomycetota bacterium]
MTRILVVQLDDIDPPARLADWLIDAGAELHITHPAHEPLPGPDYAAVVCLGGAMNANDVINYPWLADVRQLLSSCVAKEIPLLGICLGAQLLAVAMGGKVESAPDGPEVGCCLIAKRDLGWTDPLFANLPLMPDVVQFHSDAITRLPQAAHLLASSTRYPNQAFRVGRVGYGIQFHIETTPEIILQWAENNPDVAALARPGDFTPERQAELHADIEETWRPFINRFVKLAQGELAPVEPDRPQLPIV